MRKVRQTIGIAINVAGIATIASQLTGFFH
jgi:hypothetical protein